MYPHAVVVGPLTSRSPTMPGRSDRPVFAGPGYASQAEDPGSWLSSYCLLYAKPDVCLGLVGHPG